MPRVPALLLPLLLLAACATRPPALPDQTARQFWQAVIANDRTAMAELVVPGTLPDPAVLGNDKHVLRSVQIGAMTIDGDRAQVVTTLVGQDPQGHETRRVTLTTWLARVDGQWKVDGRKTVDSLLAHSPDLLLRQLDENLQQIGSAVQRGLNEGLTEFLDALNQQLPQVKKELQQLSDPDKTRRLGEQLGRVFSDSLRQALQQINQGLEELSRELEQATPPPAGQTPAPAPAPPAAPAPQRPI